MASSLLTFRYPITRIYPYKWFPWAVYVGGLCAIVLFSLLNFAANGYILTVHYTNDYNGTVADKTWAQKLAINGKVVANCQPQSLQVHSQFYTDKLSLVYGLEEIWVEGDEGARAQMLPSLQYANNPLQDCSVPLIYLEFGSDDRTAAQRGWTTWGVSAMAVVRCSVDNNRKKTWMNLTARYEFVTPEIESGAASRFVQPPEENNQSVLWWGESLLSWHWMRLVSSMENSTFREPDSESSDKVLKGSIAYERSENLTDITSLDFFAPRDFHYTFSWINNRHAGPGKMPTMSEPRCCINSGEVLKSTRDLEDQAVWPNIWIDADTFAKVFYSVILADLGQQKNPSSLFAKPSSLAEFSKIMKNPEVETRFLKAGPARAPYQENNNDNLTITPSVFFTEYLCQTPTLKSPGSLIISVIVADLVFLNAAWMLLNWYATKRLETTESTTYHCAGCGEDQEALINVKTKTQSQTQTQGYELVDRVATTD